MDGACSGRGMGCEKIKRNRTTARYLLIESGAQGKGGGVLCPPRPDEARCDDSLLDLPPLELPVLPPLEPPVLPELPPELPEDPELPNPPELPPVPLLPLIPPLLLALSELPPNPLLPEVPLLELPLPEPLLP